MTHTFLYSDIEAERFLDDLLDSEDGWYRFVEQHRDWGFDDREAAAMIRDRSRGKYHPSAEHMAAMHDAQRQLPETKREAA